MQPDDPGPLSPLARDLCVRATAIGLQDDAIELAALVHDLDLPLPALAEDRELREFQLMFLLALERRRALRIAKLAFPASELGT